MKSFRNFLIRFLLSGIIWAGTIVFVQAQSYPLNLGFEQIDTQSGLPLEWEMIPTLDAVVRIDSTESRNGKYALYICKTSKNSHPRAKCRLKLPCALPPGTMVEAGYYARTRKVTAGRQILISLQYEGTSLLRALPELLPGWNKSMIIERIANSSSLLSISIEFAGVGEIWIDDVYLKINGQDIRQKEALFLSSTKIPSIGMDFLVSPKCPLPDTAFIKRQALTSLCDSLYAMPAETMPSHPASAYFPGEVKKETGRITRKISLVHKPLQDSSLIRLADCFTANREEVWYSTGLYAVPGEVVKVGIPGFLKGKLGIQIGSHTQNLQETAGISWKRMPKILNQKPLSQDTTLIANPFGGLIYITCPKNLPAFRTEIEVKGSVAAPYYVSGKTSPEEWTSMLEQSGAPWGEFESKTLILTLPIETLREIQHPEEVADLWDQVVCTMYDLAGLSPSLFHKQRIVPDIQLRNPGILGVDCYPIKLLYNPLDKHKLNILINPKRLNQSPSHRMGYTILHELGHNVQNLQFRFEGTTEATNNLFALYVYDSLFKSREGAYDYITDLLPLQFLLSNDLSDWKNNSRLSFVIFQLLQKEFGWEPFKLLFKKFNQESVTDKVYNNQEQVDYWVLELSEATKRNLVPYFEKWHVQVSDSIKKSVSKYPEWMPAVLMRKL